MSPALFFPMEQGLIPEGKNTEQDNLGTDNIPICFYYNTSTKSSTERTETASLPQHKSLPLLIFFSLHGMKYSSFSAVPVNYISGMLTQPCRVAAIAQECSKAQHEAGGCIFSVAWSTAVKLLINY